MAEIPDEYTDLYVVVPQARIRAALETDRDTYTAVLINRKGCANSALLCQRVLEVLLARYGGRFGYFDGTTVERLVLEAGAARLETGRGAVTAERVVLCTNGFTHLVIENPVGPAIGRRPGGLEESVVGYMAAFTGPPGRPAAATSYILISAKIGPMTPRTALPAIVGAALKPEGAGFTCAPARKACSRDAPAPRLRGAGA